MALLPLVGASQTQSMTRTVASIDAGPFEFPIAGTFPFRRENGATVLEAADKGVGITIGFFRSRSVGADGERASQIATVESLIKRNWERFATEEKGAVKRPFRRVALPNELTVFSMATDYVTDDQRRYYVQFAVTDGTQIATLFFEGVGSSLAALSEHEPVVHRVKRAHASN